MVQPPIFVLIHSRLTLLCPRYMTHVREKAVAAESTTQTREKLWNANNRRAYNNIDIANVENYTTPDGRLNCYDKK